MKRADENLAFMLRYENVAWYERGKVRILDRRIYPREVKFVYCSNHMEVAQAITDMVTQSAGPFTAAGMGMALAAYECKERALDKQIEYLKKAAHGLANARPTTANRMTLVVNGCLMAAKIALDAGEPVDMAIFQHSLKTINNRYTKIGIVAKHLVKTFPHDGKIMTQCFGETIVGMMLKKAMDQGKALKIFCPETRPYLQGARLTATVAQEQGFDVTVITDNMPALIMKNKNIDVFTSAADSIYLDGHIVNKIGTMQIAIVAKHFGIPYFVTGIPDKDKPDISQVNIEERNPEEVLGFNGIKHTIEGVKGYYPSFDITPPHLVSGVVTDKGIFTPYNVKEYFDTETENYY